MRRIIECDQGSAEWVAARMGLPTASMFQTIITPKGRGGRETYMRKLAGEVLTHEPMENFQNLHMERGKYMEAEARDYYAFTRDVEPQRVGFIINHGAGCSPDSLVGDDGVLEIKTAEPHIVIDHILGDDFPPEHKAQCQGNLWIAEREWIDCVIYPCRPGIRPVLHRAMRDDVFIKDLAAKIDRFNAELADLVERVRRYGMQEAAPDSVLMAG
jgi:hypothetical protein